MTHITAQYLSITSYNATSIRHIRLPPPDSPLDPASIVPKPLPALEGKRIIQIASGDYHDVALTEGGEVWTWGAGAHGQLGTGKITTMQDEPERVVFAGEDSNQQTDGQEAQAAEPGAKKEGNRRFAFGITAAGWHTGALLLGDNLSSAMAAVSATRDLSSSGQIRNNEDSSAEELLPADRRPDPWADNGRIVNPGHIVDGPNPRLPPVFRVGYAGRGSVIGNVARRNWQRRQRAQGGGEAAADGDENNREDEDAAINRINGFNDIEGGSNGRDHDDNGSGDMDGGGTTKE